MNTKNKLMHTLRLWPFAALIMLALCAWPAHAQEPDATPPPPAAPRSPQIPRPVERTLANGLRVIVVERKNMPLVTATLYVKNGGEIDPPALAGLADMTASLLTKGTDKRSAPEIAEAIEALGGSLDSDAGWDRSTATVNVMSARFAPALAILAEIVRRPTFKDEEIERLRQQYLDDLQVALGDPGQLARFVISRVVFGDAPYGHPLSGTPESIARIKRPDIVRLHATYYRPDNAILVIGGDITPATAFTLTTRLFGDWRKPRALLPNTTKQTARAQGPAAGRALL